MLACYSLHPRVQIKLSEKGPTCPEGVATHTVPSYEQTPLHAAGLQWLPRAKNGIGQRNQRERENKGGRKMQKEGEETRKRQKGSMQIVQDLTDIFLDN